MLARGLEERLFNLKCGGYMILEKSVAHAFIRQALDPPSYTKKSLITIWVTTIFFVTLFESMSYRLNACSTDLSRMNLGRLASPVSRSTMETGARV